MQMIENKEAIDYFKSVNLSLGMENDLELLKTEQKVSPDLVFRDPYFLDFLGLADTYSEKDLETSIIVELQRFITEMGSDFAFLQIGRGQYTVKCL